METNHLILIIIGVVAGGLGGALTGIAAGLGCDLARRGQKRCWVFCSLYIAITMGGLAIVAGIAAIYSGQLITIWLALLLFVIGGAMIVYGFRALRKIKNILHEQESNSMVEID